MSITSAPGLPDGGPAPTKPSIAAVGSGGLVSAALQSHSGFAVAGVYNACSRGVPIPGHATVVSSLDRLVALQPDVYVVGVPAEDRQAAIETIVAPILGADEPQPAVIVIDNHVSASDPAITRRQEIEQTAPVVFLYAHPLRLRMPAKMAAWLEQIGPLKSVDVSCTRWLTDGKRGRSPIELLSDPLDLMFWACPATLRSATGPTEITAFGSLLKAVVGIQTKAGTVIPAGITARYSDRRRHFEIRFEGHHDETIKIWYRPDDLTGEDHLTVSLLDADDEIDSVRTISQTDAWELVLDDAAAVLAALRGDREFDESLARLQTPERELLISATQDGLRSAADSWALCNQAR